MTLFNQTLIQPLNQKEVFILSKQANVMSGLINKVQEIVSGTESQVQNPDNTDFISWFAPGIPFSNDDLSFLKTGLGNAVSGDDARKKYRNARELSTLLDLVPQPGQLVDSQATDRLFATDGRTIGDLYDNILKYSEVADGELTEKQEAKLVKFSDLLVSTVKETNIITDEITERVVDGPIAAGYKKYQKAYMDAFTQFQNMRIAALRSETPMAVDQWSYNAKTYESNMQNAYDDWVTPNKGFKNEYEQILGYIEQTTQRDLSIYKRNLQSKLLKSKLNDVDSGQSFYYTGLSPSSFLESGWTDFTFAASASNKYNKETETSWKAEASFLGLFSIGGNSSGKVSDSLQTADFSDTKISFSLTQVPISRPWFDIAFLKSRNWRFSSIAPFQNISGGPGNFKPNDVLPAIPVTAIMIKDVTIETQNSELKNTLHSLATEAGGGVGWGFFKIGGSASHSNSESSNTVKKNASGIKIEGMQLIGLKCSSLPQLPNPLPSIEKWK